MNALRSKHLLLRLWAMRYNIPNVPRTLLSFDDPTPERMAKDMQTISEFVHHPAFVHFESKHVAKPGAKKRSTGSWDRPI